jgi:cyanophycinase
VRRPAFAGYALYDLMLRLVEGDPLYYRRDSALAYDEEREVQVSLELERRPRRSRALRAVREGEIRYSAINFELRVQTCHLPLAQRPVESTVVLPPDPVPEARLILLGNSPLKWSEQSLQPLLAELRQPVGILATAAGDPHDVAASYLEWLRARGVRAEILDVSLANIERAGRDRGLLKRIAGMGSLMFTGGVQRRLTETLLHCADATPVLHAVISAYERGTPLVGVAAAASAFATRMIVEGDSEAALRHGSSEDAGFSGVVVEPGIGLTTRGIIDQNFLERRRLGRLLVACAAHREPIGFGLCEESALVMSGGEQRMRAIGRSGVIVATLQPEQVTLAPPHFSPEGIRLFHIEPGQEFSPASIAAETPDHSGAGLALLERAVADLARDYNRGLAPGLAEVDPVRLRSALLESALPGAAH